MWFKYLLEGEGGHLLLAPPRISITIRQGIWNSDVVPTPASLPISQPGPNWCQLIDHSLLSCTHRLQGAKTLLLFSLRNGFLMWCHAAASFKFRGQAMVGSCGPAGGPLTLQAWYHTNGLSHFREEVQISCLALNNHENSQQTIRPGSPDWLLHSAEMVN